MGELTGCIDLHLHTTASDGTDTPAQLVEKAAALGLAAIAVTDHDTVAGLPEAAQAGTRYGVEVIAGIELSTDYRDNNVHVLGYFLDPDAAALRSALDWARREFAERNAKMIAMLASDGFDISLEALEAEYPGAVLARPHMAEHLVKKGYADSIEDAFDRYLGVGRKYFLPRRRIPLAEAIAAIRASGGLASLAHPLQYGYPPDEVTTMIACARDGGVGALECIYSGYTSEQMRWLLDRAAEYGLAVSGGSDCHGARKRHISLGCGTGELAIPYEVLRRLKERAAQKE